MKKCKNKRKKIAKKRVAAVRARINRHAASPKWKTDSYGNVVVLDEQC